MIIIVKKVASKKLWRRKTAGESLSYVCAQEVERDMRNIARWKETMRFGRQLAIEAVH